MQHAYPVSVIRRAEDVYLGAGVDLMQRAAAGLAASILRRLRPASGASAVLLSGPGNNGGDGLFAAVRLLKRGVRVWAHPVVGEPHPAGLAAFLAAGGRLVEASEAKRAIESADLVIDAIFGIGGRAGLSGAAREFATYCRLTDTPVVAVDLPSGLDADQPHAADCFPADVTVTFGAAKVCHVAGSARDACGEIELIDIGLGPALATETPALVAWDIPELVDAWPRLHPETDKYGRGVVGLDVGSATYPGAGVLTALGAVYSGAGMVRVLGAPEVGQAVVRHLPNVVLNDGRVQAMVLGSGWGERADGQRAISAALERDVPVVLDADALRYLPDTVPSRCLLTPHAGELARLLGIERADVTADPIGKVTEAVERTGATVLLKGATQYVATPHDPVIQLAIPGPARTAQAGSGDVLAGICGTLLAAGLDTTEAAVAAASIQAVTAAGSVGMPPQDLARRIPHVLRDLGADAEVGDDAE